MKMKEFIEETLRVVFQRIGIDMPANFDSILEFVVNDIEEASGFQIDGNYTSEDVLIAFRRFIECKNV